MQKKYNLSNPVVIGGVGGSGTRVIAEIVNKLGFYIGYDLSPERDNLQFLLLFKRPKWYSKARYDKNKIFTGLSLFTKSMFHKNIPRWSELKFLAYAVFEIAISGHNYKGDGRGIWPFVRAWKILTTKNKPPLKLIRWGWKEPNTHIYIDYLDEYFENFKYIHTIRHGLDMAFSENQQQLYNWGPFFGIAKPQSLPEEPKASLKYWLRANRRVFEFGQKLGNQKFLVVNFEKLCMSPEPEIKKIVSFLNICPSIDDLNKAYSIPKRPKSLGRYQNFELGQFDGTDLDELKTFGY
jgi:hypothetical protein